MKWSIVVFILLILACGKVEKVDKVNVISKDNEIGTGNLDVYHNPDEYHNGVYDIAVETTRNTVIMEPDTLIHHETADSSIVRVRIIPTRVELSRKDNAYFTIYGKTNIDCQDSMIYDMEEVLTENTNPNIIKPFSAYTYIHKKVCGNYKHYVLIPQIGNNEYALLCEAARWINNIINNDPNRFIVITLDKDEIPVEFEFPE